MHNIKIVHTLEKLESSIDNKLEKLDTITQEIQFIQSKIDKAKLFDEINIIAPKIESNELKDPVRKDNRGSQQPWHPVPHERITISELTVTLDNLVLEYPIMNLTPDLLPDGILDFDGTITAKTDDSRTPTFSEGISIPDDLFKFFTHL
ncbi:21796_t:CDS:2, partial [Cetraspora pellucida]